MLAFLRLVVAVIVAAVSVLVSIVGRVAWLALFGTEPLGEVASFVAALTIVTTATASLFRFSVAFLDSSLELILLLARIKIQTRSVRRLGGSKSGRSVVKGPDRIGSDNQLSGQTGDGWGVADLLDSAVKEWPDRPFMVIAGTDERVTFAEIDARANRVARWLKDTLHVPQGATVALLVDGGPDYLALWLGAAKAGCCAALLNTHLRGAPLAHAILTALPSKSTSNSASPSSSNGGGNSNAAASGPRLLIASASLAAAALRSDVRTALSKSNHGDSVVDDVLVVELADSGATVGLSENSGVEDNGLASTSNGAAQLLQRTSPARVDRAWRSGLGWDASLFYIYTSGTTGLPKAATINHLRFWSAGCVLRTLGALEPDDALYCPLPLYHASGGVMGVSACLQAGCCLVHRAKFSASQFSADLVLHHCTAMQYIGELGRYLANAPASPLDGRQQLRVALGNGLRPEVWPTFQKRYGIGKIVEFYAATEGNTNLFNNCASPAAVGAVGVVPWFAKVVYPVRLAKVDPVTGSLWRDPHTGFGAECQPGEVGQVLGLINSADPSRRFDGYTDRRATEAKVGRHVFQQGDAWFLSGDLMKQDAWGFFYWVDRAGDTFRWKGENVSTSEVEGVLSRTLAHLNSSAGGSSSTKGAVAVDVVVYGVEVPRCDGRAGMAALAMKRPGDESSSSSSGSDSTNSGNGVEKGCFEEEDAAGFDGAKLFAALQGELPAFAQPVFVRLVCGPEGLAVTATHKHQKDKLRKEGFDFVNQPGATAAPDRKSDLVFVRDAAAKAYVPLTAGLSARISSGALRL